MDASNSPSDRNLGAAPRVSRGRTSERAGKEPRRAILLRLGEADCNAQCATPGECRECKRPRLIVIRLSEVEEMRLTKASKLIPHEHRSLLDELFGVPLTCIPPECRWDGAERRIGPFSFL